MYKLCVLFQRDPSGVGCGGVRGGKHAVYHYYCASQTTSETGYGEVQNVIGKNALLLFGKLILRCEPS